MSALRPMPLRPRRPAVLDAARTALIPLRPLTITEILDGGFLIVRRNLTLMVGLPLVIAGATAAYVLAGVGLWVLLGNTTAQTAQIVLVVLMGLLSPSLQIGVSPRGATAIMHTARAWAWLSGRDYVSPDDVKALAFPTLRHRVSLRPEAELEGVTTDAVIESVLASVPVPR